VRAYIRIVVEMHASAAGKTRYALPITHLVVEPEAASAGVMPTGPDEDARSSGMPAAT
jgi:hypothetical protein